MENRKICAAYIRVSTDDQLDYSPESQRKLLLEYAKKNGMVLPEENIYTDDGISGRKAAKRPGFLALISAAKSKPKPFDVILVWKFSRFARNQEESIVYKSMLRKNCGIEVVSISEQLPDGEFGSLIERIIEWMDEYYSIRLSGEVRRGMTERVKQGGAVSVAPIGYVYQDKQLVIDPESAEVVKMIFDEFLHGAGMLSIAKKLNDMGIRTRRGNTWENRTVRYVLNNPVYIGKIRWSEEGANDYHINHGWTDNTIMADGTHKPLISESVFAAVQEKIQEYEKRYKSSTSKIHQRENVTTLLQGLLKCSVCGGTMTRTTSVGMNCSQYVHGKCTVSHYTPIYRMEQIVLSAVEEQLKSTEMDIIRRELPRQSNQVAILEQQLQKEEIILKKCKDAYLAGIDTLEEYKESKANATARIENIKKLLQQQNEERPIDKQAFAEKHLPIIQRIKDPDVPVAERNRLLRSFIDHIVFNKHDKSVSIVFYE